MTNTRAKFVCYSSTKIGGGGTGQQETRTFLFTPVHGNSEENKKFFASTPGGRIELSVVNPEVDFINGQTYYVDFTPSDK